MVRRSSDYDARCDRFVEDLLAIMTMEEKIGQLISLSASSDTYDVSSPSVDEQVRTGRVGSVVCPCAPEQFARLQRIAIEESRLGIPLLFAKQQERGDAVVMPSAFALAATWRPQLHYNAARSIAAEARDRGHHWLLGPQVVLSDVVPKSQWSSSWGASEALARHHATATVRGVETRQPDEFGALSCLRVDHPSWHTEGSPFIPARRLRLLAGVMRDAGPGSIALGKCAGKDSARRQAAEITPVPIGWASGYDGIDLAEWAEIAMAADLDVDGFPYSGLSIPDIVRAVEDGRLPQRRLDDAVRRIIGAKFDLGLFQAEHFDTTAKRQAFDIEEARKTALAAARHAIVLLRNEFELLPLGYRSGDILVVGEAAACRRLPVDASRPDTVSLIDGLEALCVPHGYVSGLALRNGCSAEAANSVIDGDRMAIGMASEAAKRAGTVVLVVSDVDEQCLPQRLLMEALLAANRNVVLVTLGDAPHDPTIAGGKLPCVVHAGGLGTFSGQAIAEVLTGIVAPSGRLPVPLDDDAGGRGFTLGHGLGYAEIRLADRSVDLLHDRICLRATLENVDQVAGTETVQIYIRRPVPSGRTGTQLVCFGQVTVAPGETQAIQFEISGDELGEFDAGDYYHVAPGRYAIGIGLSEARAVWSQVDIPQAVAHAMIRSLARGPLPALFGRLRQAG